MNLRLEDFFEEFVVIYVNFFLMVKVDGKKFVLILRFLVIVI